MPSVVGALAHTKNKDPTDLLMTRAVCAEMAKHFPLPDNSHLGTVRGLNYEPQRSNQQSDDPTIDSVCLEHPTMAYHGR